MNRTVLISGAGSGLGLALSRLFLDSGDRVFGVTRTRRHWPSAKKYLGSWENFKLLQKNLNSETPIRDLFQKIKKEAGALDLLINCAGYADRPLRSDLETLKGFQKNLTHNLLNTFLMCKYGLPLLRSRQNAWLINIASYAGKRAVPFLAAYSASKFGVVALSQAIAKENPESGFKCITVCPGGMNTEMRRKLFGKADASKQQSPEFVAEKILEVLDGKIAVESGGDVVIRHGKVTAVNPPPPA